MRKTKINWSRASYPPNSLYENCGLKFSWLTIPEKHSFEKNSFEQYSQVTNWHQCRETFANEICRYVGSKACGSWSYDRKLDFKKTRVAVSRKHNTESFKRQTLIDNKWMRCSVRILNILERSQGWTLSRVYMCDDENLLKYSINVFVFISSPKWMQAPQLLSLYLLIIRLGNFWKIFSKFKQIDDLESVVKDVSIARIRDNNLDLEWIENTWKYWMLMLNNHNSLFFKKKLIDNFKSNTGFFGIKSLIDGEYGSAEILAEWKKIISTVV